MPKRKSTTKTDPLLTPEEAQALGESLQTALASNAKYLRKINDLYGILLFLAADKEGLHPKDLIKDPDLLSKHYLPEVIPASTVTAANNLVAGAHRKLVKRLEKKNGEHHQDERGQSTTTGRSPRKRNSTKKSTKANPTVGAKRRNRKKAARPAANPKPARKGKARKSRA